MTRYAKFTRRKFIEALAVIAGICIMKSVGGSTNFITQGRNDQSIKKISRIFTNKASARSIGRSYLIRKPMENNPNLLLNMIFNDKDGYNIFLYGSVESIGKYVRTRQNYDFHKGNTVNIEGWILSETEVRLCALLCTIS
jgi:hypothetical protein